MKALQSRSTVTLHVCHINLDRAVFVRLQRAWMGHEEH